MPRRGFPPRPGLCPAPVDATGPSPPPAEGGPPPPRGGLPAPVLGRGGGWGTASMSGGPLEAEGTRAPLSPPRLGALTGCWAPPASPRGAPGSRSGRAEGSAA